MSTAPAQPAAIKPTPDFDLPKPPHANAALVLCDGTVIWGRGVGAVGMSTGEVVFNTSMTGYQEVLTDPSYAGQIITFTFPHIGNVGTNNQDIEGLEPKAAGLILRTDITTPSNWRSVEGLNAWLKQHGVVGICDVDTRALTKRIREQGAPNGTIVAVAEGETPDLKAAWEKAVAWHGLKGLDLAKDVTNPQQSEWDEAGWTLEEGYSRQTDPVWHVVAVDFGAKRNILRCLAAAGCRVTVVPATTTAEAILAMNPDGVFLSNGPGDPAATGEYAVPMIQGILASGVPLFGICLGHQMLARAVGASTYKLEKGHRGANHPVQDLQTGKVEITSQNHGFCVDESTLPAGVEVTHRSLFDKTVEGIALKDKPAFSVQYHPEARPGPQDSHYLFRRFLDVIRQRREQAA